MHTVVCIFQNSWKDSDPQKLLYVHKVLLFLAEIGFLVNFINGKIWKLRKIKKSYHKIL